MQQPAAPLNSLMIQIIFSDGCGRTCVTDGGH